MLFDDLLKNFDSITETGENTIRGLLAYYEVLERGARLPILCYNTHSLGTRRLAEVSGVS